MTVKTVALLVFCCFEKGLDGWGGWGGGGRGEGGGGEGGGLKQE